MTESKNKDFIKQLSPVHRVLHEALIDGDHKTISYFIELDIHGGMNHAAWKRMERIKNQREFLIFTILFLLAIIANLLVSRGHIT